MSTTNGELQQVEQQPQRHEREDAAGGAPPPGREEPTSARLVFTLTLAGLLSGLLLVVTYELTLPTILANKARALQAAVLKVVPGATAMQKLVPRDGKMAVAGAGDKSEGVYAAYDAAGSLRGYAIVGSGPGFQDTIELLYGFDPGPRRIVGMEVLESRETPGLGDKIYKDEAFVANFRALAVDPKVVAVKKSDKRAANEVDTITGATISSKAVVKIINDANDRWLERLPSASSSPPLQPPAQGGQGGAPSSASSR